MVKKEVVGNVGAAVFFSFRAEQVFFSMSLCLRFVRCLSQKWIRGCTTMHIKRYYQAQQQQEDMKQLLTLRDGKSMSSYELESLFKNISTVIGEVSKDPKNYEPNDLDEIEKLSSSVREIRLEYAPTVFRFLCSNFMVWYHGWKGKKVYNNLYNISVIILLAV